MTKSMRYRLILAKSSDFNWLIQDRHALRDLSAVAEDGRNHCVPQQDLPFEEIIVYSHMQLTTQPVPHTYASRQACTMQALEESYNQPGPTEK